ALPILYPEVGLAEARDKALAARRLIREGADPVVERRRHQTRDAANTFQAIADDWIASRENDWSPSYRAAVQSALAANVYPQIGSMPLRTITVPILRDALL